MIPVDGIDFRSRCLLAIEVQTQFLRCSLLQEEIFMTVGTLAREFYLLIFVNNNSARDSSTVG